DIILSTRFSPSAVVARKAAFAEAGNFDTNLRSSEDRDMWIRIATRRRVQLEDARLVQVCRHASNMSGNADRMKKNMRITLRKAYENGAVSKWRWLFWLKVCAVFYHQTALMYLGTGRPWPALQDAAKSLLAWPLWLQTREIGSIVHCLRLRTVARILIELFRIDRRRSKAVETGSMRQ
ncbi:MAG: hypothetical protein AB1705_23440, partial [Verrucomicrobiota bacterium]